MVEVGIHMDESSEVWQVPNERRCCVRACEVAGELSE